MARLARLELSESEVERMVGELLKVLDHVETIGRLELGAVKPTTHVTHPENVMRADVPRPSWPSEVILAAAPDPTPGGFRVPSPGAGARG